MPPAPAPALLPPTLAAELSQLHPDQRQAATHRGSLTVLAGPGAGKTRTLVARVGFLLATTSLRRGVAALTYTDAAAAETTRRLYSLGIRPGRRLSSTTVHAFCLHGVLRPYARLIDEGFHRDTTTVADGNTCRSLWNQAAHECGLGAPTSQDRSTLERLRRVVYAGESTDDFHVTYKRTVLRYEELLREDDLIDFEAMTGRALALLRKSKTAREQIVARYPHIVIDEYQDLGPVLHGIVEVLLDAGALITAVGDPDQVLYAYQGANSRYLQELQKRPDFHTVRLTLNYRSGSALIDASRAVLGRDRGYRAAPERTDTGTVSITPAEGDLDDHAALAVKAVRERIAKGLALESVAILYRSQGPVLESLTQALDAAQIPYDREKHRRRPSGPLAELIALCTARALAGPLGVSNRPSTGTARALPLRELASLWKRQLLLADLAHPDATRRSLAQQLATVLDATSPRPKPGDDARSFLQELVLTMDLVVLANASADPRDSDTADELNDLQEAPLTMAELAGGQIPGHIAVTTYHSAKGREFSVVVLPGLIEGLVPSYFPNRPPTPSGIAAARREFYVAITRAKDEAVLITGNHYTMPANKYYAARNRLSRRTRFVDEIEQVLM
ncbi:ATP-dependent helicase [Streptomyces sp. H10-C2]|uniref:ATP-dependent helicase n=1 Tax=Streptomyces sp. H10-C2 TaxID=3046210 RepID=UPI0024BB9881|nr:MULTISPECIES: ATP-dependent helicase [unclassified Streptomyces]MDJ0347388.1 ATP-dependent helicase [Streptomyces sp. PH10-H1]MDJ0375626.1 ATP-dependent helicase [Streptomyces sp. H10-C2]